MAQISEVFQPDRESPRPVMELRGVTKRFGAVTALDRVDLGLRGGEVTTILGPNGAGKTTAVRLLLGLPAPWAISIRGARREALKRGKVLGS